MPVTTNTVVFDFMGSGTNERTTFGAMLTGMIDNTEQLIKNYIGRALTAVSFDRFFWQGNDAEILGRRFFGLGVYHDLVSIDTVTESGTVLTVDVDYQLQGGVLHRLGANWPAIEGELKIKGVAGLVVGSGVTWATRLDIVQILIEEVAIKSGLWGRIMTDGNGDQFKYQGSGLSEYTTNRLNAYRVII